MAKSATTWVNPEMLKWARERLGLSPEKVADHSKELEKRYTRIKAEELARWEKGETEPELEHLESLSELYVCPVGYFFLPQPPVERLPLSFRGLAPGKKSRLKPRSLQTLYRFRELADWTTHIIEEFGVEWDVKIPHERQLRRREELDALVQQERERLGFTEAAREEWSSAEEAFIWWRRKVENQGVFCFQMKLEPSDIRGASLWMKSRYPFILVNHQDVESATGRIFTLLHEYGHLLIEREGLVCDFRGYKPGREPEPFANRFAAQMLLSYEELADELRRIQLYARKTQWSDNVLWDIGRPFAVSRHVIAIMLEEMELAPEGFYQMKRDQWEEQAKKYKPWGRGGKGGRPTNNQRALAKVGYSLARVLSLPSKRESEPWTDLAYVLDMRVDKVDGFLNWAREEVGSQG